MTDSRPAKLPDLRTVPAAEIVGYSVDDDGRMIRLWINAFVDAEGPVRVFTAETDDEVTVLVVPTPLKYQIGYTATWSDEDVALNVADVNATLAAPLGARRLVDAGSSDEIKPLPQWIVDRRRQDPAPRVRPVGPQSCSDPLTFRGEI